MKVSGDWPADSAAAPGLAWELALVPRGLEKPSHLQSSAPVEWVSALVPGTIVQALKAAGRWHAEVPGRLAEVDAWYRCALGAALSGELCFEGLAGHCEVWLGDTLLARHETMYRPLVVTLPTVDAAGAFIYLCVRCSISWTTKRTGRARWRPRMVVPSTLREVRQTLLGHMPGWCPDIPALGPYGRVRRRPTHADPKPSITRLCADWTEAGATLDLQLICPQAATSVAVQIAGLRLCVARIDDRTWAVHAPVPGATPWWPHTHGSPNLHELEVEVDGVNISRGKIGFRRIEFDPLQSHLGLKVNGVPVFCRGVCWTPADLEALWADPATYDTQVRRIAHSGMNMVRVGGTMLYEHDAFYAACSEAGVLVWQDYMLANFDYPARDQAFVAELEAEAHHFLGRTVMQPCLAVLCGGSEVRQQAEMLGTHWPADDPIYDGVLRQASASRRPDVSYVPNSPWGGPTPFSTRHAITHYYGVGAYLRPLEDARRAEVGFAAECLALAHVPSESQLEGDLASQPASHAWKRGTPRDRGAGWDFDDVRDHYLQRLYGVEPAQLRYEDAGRYLDLSRAVSCDLAESLYSEWRRPASTCAGGLVWQLRDLIEGSGWGLWDKGAHNKPVWHALQRVLRPVQLLVTDEGLDGLDLHVVNETAGELQLELTLACLRDGEKVVAEGRCTLAVGARGGYTVNSNELLGRFYDITYAYRFGPLAHEVTYAVLRDPTTGTILGEAFHLPRRSLPRNDLGLAATVTQDGDELWMTVSTQRFAQYVHFSSATHEAQDDWFHLAPGAARRVQLLPTGRGQDPALTGGTLTALNALSSTWVKLSSQFGAHP